MDQHLLPSAHLHHHSLPPRRCCVRQALQAPTTARRHPATRPRHLRLLDTTRRHRRHSSTLPRLLVTHRRAPTTARHHPTFMGLDQPHPLTLRRRLRGLQRLLRLIPQQAQASSGALVHSSHRPARATPRRRLLSLLARRVQELLAINTLLTRRQTSDKLCVKNGGGWLGGSIPILVTAKKKTTWN
ncbi:hypothetical protein LB505_000500 [Fusarium chuoi]|nr:hypothetical protein LB505_000500 [Fusarium chuoi]